MALLIVSFLAGVLTVLAPCILPLLPVVIGASAGARSKFTPYIVIASLCVSIIIFTFLLKASTIFITIPPSTWSYLSGGILAGFGLLLCFPGAWEKIPGMAKLSGRSNKLVGTGYQKKSIWGDIIIGASLGPVFSTCSPTYFVILATVLPVSFGLGLAYLLAYVIGLASVLLLIALLGQSFTKRLLSLSDSRGRFKFWLGVIFVLLGIAIITGFDKVVEIGLLDYGYFNVTNIEQRLLEKLP